MHCSGRHNHDASTERQEDWAFRENVAKKAIGGGQPAWEIFHHAREEVEPTLTLKQTQKLTENIRGRNKSKDVDNIEDLEAIIRKHEG